MAGEGVKWSRLIAGAGIASRWDGLADPTITAVVEDSRQVSPGTCFVATRGLRADGHAFVDGAVRAGASAVISERPVSLPASVPTVCVASARGLAGRLAAVLYGLDQRQRDGRLHVVGVTGTNGKSTFCYLLRAILQRADRPTAMLGTIQYDLLSRTVEASMTTPPPATLVGFLAEAVRAGATHAVMEVSSHALDQSRCEGIRFAVGVFSNLSGDHLDYHQDMASYLRAKKRLFDGLDAGAVAVVNRDDEASEQMIADCRARVVRYGLLDEPGASPGEPEVYARVREMSAAGTRFDLSVRCGRADSGGGEVESWEVFSPLVGKHNVQNCVAAAAAAVALGVSRDAIVAGLAAVQCIPGRLQRVLPGPGGGERGGDPGFAVLVDYAHTDDALANVLSAVRPLTVGKLIVLFGCGGDRDRTKRRRMARAAAEWADRIVVTSDNPRTEDPQRIIDDIMAGFSPQQLESVWMRPDRRRAIAEAIAMADPGDLVLLAGKGHERYQEIGRERIPFDDAAVAAAVLNETVNARC